MIAKFLAAGGTINRELATLSKMLSLAERNKRLLQASRFENPAEPPARSGFVTREQFDSIAARLPVELAAGMLVAFTCGWRKMEILTRKSCGRCSPIRWRGSRSWSAPAVASSRGHFRT